MVDAWWAILGAAGWFFGGYGVGVVRTHRWHDRRPRKPRDTL